MSGWAENTAPNSEELCNSRMFSLKYVLLILQIRCISGRYCVTCTDPLDLNARFVFGSRQTKNRWVLRSERFMSKREGRAIIHLKLGSFLG